MPMPMPNYKCQPSCNSWFRQRRSEASCLGGQTASMNSGFVWKTLSQRNMVEEEYKTISNDTCALQVHICVCAHIHTHTHMHTQREKIILKLAFLQLCNIGVRDSSEKMYLLLTLITWILSLRLLRRQQISSLTLTHKDYEPWQTNIPHTINNSYYM